ncbi:hypothetical protein S40285_04858 [Stachybotrys chlorohalonatus IBT 40285]|uniref:AT hook domain-containing protein n=1 Tax=Stachybotrys chlorohalonatus (strain IBT 40285) TaxID=1283841 RepID=A0A084QAA1_STAC4|nr:hypothetical protein S40285_04858 [Stachybotrys chlorohalonata IBT 40285]
MVQGIIADSDDDGDDVLSPHQAQPHPTVAGHAAPGRSSDHLGTLTDSTDSAFFQSVFDEQNAAAIEFAQMASGGEVVEPGTVPDPYEIPSSPEASPVPRLGASRGKRQVHMERPRMNSSAEGAIDEIRPADDAQADVHDIAQRSRKRRRIGASPKPEPESGDGIHETPPGETYPSSYKAEIPEMLEAVTPTLPVNNETSFFVPLKPLSSSQKMDYQNTLADSSQSLGDPAVMELRYDLKVVSSSSATNINTPRKDFPSSNIISTLPHTQSDDSRSRRRTRGTPMKHINSSPDVIAETGMAMKEPEPEHAIEQPCSDLPLEDEVLNSQDGDREYNPTKPSKAKGKGDSHKKAAPPKKGRGRPKKTTTQEESPPAPLDTTAPNIDDEVEVVATKVQKKKRGRPKKPGKTPRKTPAPELEQAATNDEQPSNETANGKGNDDVVVEEEGQQGKDTTEPKADPKTSTTSEAKMTPLRELDPNGKNENKPDATAKAPPNESETAEKKANSKAKQTPTPSSKPLYRVGLSKRSRIAPLLKIIRKD